MLIIIKYLFYVKYVFFILNIVFIEFKLRLRVRFCLNLAQISNLALCLNLTEISICSFVYLKGIRLVLFDSIQIVL